MIALVSAVFFVGYTLVYAAVANGGKLALHPWDALRIDAYTGTSGGAPASSPGGPSTFDKILGIGSKVVEIGGLIP